MSAASSRLQPEPVVWETAREGRAATQRLQCRDVTELSKQGNRFVLTSGSIKGKQEKPVTKSAKTKKLQLTC